MSILVEVSGKTIDLQAIIHVTEENMTGDLTLQFSGFSPNLKVPKDSEAYPIIMQWVLRTNPQ